MIQSRNHEQHTEMDREELLVLLHHNTQGWNQAPNTTSRVRNPSQNTGNKIRLKRFKETWEGT